MPRDFEMPKNTKQPKSERVLKGICYFLGGVLIFMTVAFWVNKALTVRQEDGMVSVDRNSKETFVAFNDRVITDPDKIYLPESKKIESQETSKTASKSEKAEKEKTDSGSEASKIEEKMEDLETEMEEMGMSLPETDEEGDPAAPESKLEVQGESSDGSEEEAEPETVSEDIPETAPDLRYLGEVESDGNRFTWYSENALPGEGLHELNGNGRWTDEDGYVRDGDGYIALASPWGQDEVGTVVDTPWGKGKVYDECEDDSYDVYTNW